MVSIDLLAPQEENDNSPTIETGDTNELVNNLVGAVKELVDVQADTTNKMVDKMREIINASNTPSDLPQDADTTSDPQGADDNREE